MKAMTFTGLLLMVAVLLSCSKAEENYHANDHDVYVYNVSPDSVEMHINGSVRIMAPGDTAIRLANETSFAWFGYEMRVWRIHNNHVNDPVYPDMKGIVDHENWIHKFYIETKPQL